MVLKALKLQQNAPFHHIVWPGLIADVQHRSLYMANAKILRLGPNGTYIFH